MPDERVRHPKIAIVGAGGTVGSQIHELITQRDFVFDQLKLFGSEASDVTESEETNGASLPIAALKSPQDLASCDIAFLAIPAADADAIANARPGPLLIDLSCANRMPSSSAPLAAPGLTSHEQLHRMRRAGRVGVPHPAAQVIASILRAVDLRDGFAGISILLSASSRGREALAAFLSQSTDLLNARLDLEDEETQTAFNVFMPINTDQLANAIAAQVRNLTGEAPALVAQIASVPAFHGSAIGLFLPAARDTSQWAARLRAAPGIVLVETAEASSFVDAIGQEAVITRIVVNPAGAALWCVFDAARLAALTAIWIAETLSE